MSVSRTGATGSLVSGIPYLGADGRTVIFESFATDLVENDFNDARDVLLVRLAEGDADQDGMDDGWEMTFFGELNRDGRGDADLDGATDLAEFIAGTNPTDKASVLRVLAATSLTAGKVTVFWESIPGKNYQVEWKDELGNQEWTALPGYVLATSALSSVVDSPSAIGGRRFYRVKVLPCHCPATPQPR